jgi:Zn-dependent protease with chaperone function
VINRLRSLLLVCSLGLIPSLLAAQDTVFSGAVTNLGYDGTSGFLTGSLLLTVRWVGDTGGIAHLSIGAPLGGSGAADVRAWRDTLVFRSISPTGDTIVWIGWRTEIDTSDSQLLGAYRINGGQYEGQGGRWEAALSSTGRDYLAGFVDTQRPTSVAGRDLVGAFAPFIAKVSAYDSNLSGDSQGSFDAASPQADASSASESAPIRAKTIGLWILGIVLALLVGWVASFRRELRFLGSDRRVLLALVFVPGLYLLLALSVALMIGVAGGILVGLWKAGESVNRIPVGIMLAIVVGAFLGIVSVLSAVVDSVSRASFPVHAEQLSRPDAPKLYSMLDRLAKRLGAHLPDSVVLEMGTSFFVTEAKVHTFTGACGNRTLCVSAPLLHFLTVGEVEAILAHELAHFSGADTAYSRRFYPVYHGASQALRGMAAVGDENGGRGTAAAIPLLLPQMLVGWYLAWFAKLERQNSREREFRADRLASQATAPAVLASGLLKVHAYAPFWLAIPQGIRELHSQGRAYVNAAVAFEEARGNPDLLEAVRTGETHQLTHPTDTHPSLADRLSALGFADRATAPLTDGPPATDLVVDLSAREERLTDALSYIVLRQSGLLNEASAELGAGAAQ